VLREEFAELVAELRGERLVVRDHERRLADVLDDPGHRRRLAGAGGAEQGLVALTRLESLGELLDRGRLVAGRQVQRRRFQLRHAGQGIRVTVAAGRPPYGAYTRIVSLFGGGLALAGALAHALHRDPREHDGLDLVVLGAATFKASRPIARDEVTSFLRAPFVEGEAHEGGEEPVE